MYYISPEMVMAVSSQVLHMKTETVATTVKAGLLESALGRPHATYFGKDFCPTIEDKAAALMYGLARNHAFLDGNKRTCVLSTLLFLQFNGYDLDLSDVDDVLTIVIELAAGNVEQDELAVWIRQRMVPFIAPV